MRDTWVPPSNPAYGLLFEHYSISDIFDTKKDTRFIRNVLLAALSALDKGLCFARQQVFLREMHLHAFFPMVLDTVNPESLLDSLIALIVDEPDEVKGKTVPLLKEYHPELAQLVSMHLSIFPNAEPGATYAALLVEPYLRIVDIQRRIVHDSSLFCMLRKNYLLPYANVHTTFPQTNIICSTTIAILGECANIEHRTNQFFRGRATSNKSY